MFGCVPFRRWATRPPTTFAGFLRNLLSSFLRVVRGEREHLMPERTSWEMSVLSVRPMSHMCALDQIPPSAEALSALLYPTVYPTSYPYAATIARDDRRQPATRTPVAWRLRQHSAMIDNRRKRTPKLQVAGSIPVSPARKL